MDRIRGMNDQLLDSYDILEKIGEGSGGVVYKAYHKRLRQTVVLKKIIDQDQSIVRQRQEVDILKNINHSYLPHVLDFLETEDGVFTVMNYIPGKSFQQILREGARFTKEDLLKWALQLCSALNYLHTRKIPIIHGDIKPSNIMLKPDGDICLIDFNIAFFFDENTVLGCTRGYTSPEQFWAVSSKKKRDDVTFTIDNKADIYSVGATLYHLATGNVRADYTHEIDISRLSRVVGEQFARVIAKATDLNPNRRFASAYDMYQALKAVPEESQGKLKAQRKEKKKVIAAVLAAALIICMGAGGFLFYQNHRIEEYNDLTSRAKSAVEAGDLNAARQQAEKAVDIFDDKAEGYYWKDYVLYCQGRFGDCSAELEDHIPRVDEESESYEEHKSIVDLYCLKGTCRLQESDLAEAVKSFEEAEKLYGVMMRSQHYRDYAVALARNHRIAEAQEKIEKAEDAPGELAEYSRSYTEGEIKKEAGQSNEAMDCFRKTIDTLKDAEGRSEDDSFLLYRAYMGMYDIARDEKDYRACIDIMLEAEDELDKAWQMQVCRNLGQSYFDREDYSRAADRYRQVTGFEGATPTDWFNLGNACIGAGDDQGAMEAAEGYRSSLSSTTEDFNYWFLMARAEQLRQSRLPEHRVSYDNFFVYYQRAGECAELDRSGENSREMEVLDAAYREIKRKGW